MDLTQRVLGYKGGMEYHAKLNLRHECLAGDPLHPFEDPNQTASWLTTRYTSLPWTRSPFTSIPFEDWGGAANGRAAMFLRRDTFHVFRLGIARNFIASVIILLGIHGLFDDGETDFSIERRLKTAWSQCFLWCSTNRSKPASVRSFTREKLHCKKGSYPYIACKGMLVGPLRRHLT